MKNHPFSKGKKLGKSENTLTIFFKNRLLQLAKFNQTWHKSPVGERYISSHKRRPFLFRRGVITCTKLRKYIAKFKNRLLQWTNFNQTQHKLSLGEGYISLFNKGPCIFPRGDDYNIVKMKESSSVEPLGQFQPNLAKSILGKWEFEFVQLKSHTFLHWR